MGSSAEALTAGKRPKTIPTEAKKPTPTTNDRQGSEIGKPGRAGVSATPIGISMLH